MILQRWHPIPAANYTDCPACRKPYRTTETITPDSSVSAKKLEIYPGADKTSLMLVVSHTPGSLYNVLARFNALGINIFKLESRPLPQRDFDYMFYFDIDSEVHSEEFVRLINQLEELSHEFKYLGSYMEI